MGRVKAEVKAFRESLFNSGRYFCNKCNQIKPLDRFPKGSEKAQHMFGIVPQCKECFYGYVKQWAKENPDNNRRASLECKRRAIARDPEAFYQKARETARARFAANPERIRENCRRSNKKCSWQRKLSKIAHRKQIPGSLTPSQINDVFAFYGKRCLCCGAGTRISIDHIVPLTRGGVHEIWNIQPLCVACNSSKGARRFTDYRPDKGARFQEVSHVQ